MNSLPSNHEIQQLYMELCQRTRVLTTELLFQLIEIPEDKWEAIKNGTEKSWGYHAKISGALSVIEKYEAKINAEIVRYTLENNNQSCAPDITHYADRRGV